MDWIFAQLLDLVTNEKDREALTDRYAQASTDRNPIIESDDPSLLGGLCFGLVVNFIDRPFQLAIGMLAMLYLVAKLLAYLFVLFI